MEVAKHLGIPIAWDKTVWATMTLRYLGIDVDTVDQVIRIPHHKIQSLQRKIDHLLGSKIVTVKTIQSLARTMSFYAKAKPSGHTFIRRMYDVTGSLPPRYHINITSELKQDARMWRSLLMAPQLAMLSVKSSRFWLRILISTQMQWVVKMLVGEYTFKENGLKGNGVHHSSRIVSPQQLGWNCIQ